MQYLDSLGKKQTANVVRDADIGKAEALRDSGIAVRALNYLYDPEHALMRDVGGTMRPRAHG